MSKEQTRLTAKPGAKSKEQRAEDKETPRSTLNAPHSSGFTLLEIIVALLILAVGLASIFSLFSAGTHTLYRGVTDVTVSSYADTIISEYSAKFRTWSDPPENLKDQTHPSFPPYLKYDLEFTALNPDKLPDNPLDEAVLMTITVKWPRGKDYLSEKFQTILIK